MRQMRVSVRAAALAGCTLAAWLPTVGHAEDAAAASSAVQAEDQDSYHRRPGDDIIVTGVLPMRRQDTLSGVAVLQGEALTRAVRPSIGETLAHEAGVSATSFGPAPRVRCCAAFRASACAC